MTASALLQAPQRMMRLTLLALLPGVIMMFATFGYGFVINLVLAALAAVATEAIALKLRRIPPLHFLQDGSAVLTGVLLALTLPPHLPWWIPAIAAVAAIGLGKQIYGGLGNNLFNPAMLGYCIVLIAWPLHLTAWPDQSAMLQGFDLSLAIQYAGNNNGEILAAAMTGATPLESWRSVAPTPYDAVTAALQWNLINIAFALGGAWLIFKGVISWHIPAAMLLTVGLMTLLIQGDFHSLKLNLLSGATMLGAFFIATDPATSPRAPHAMLLFGIGTAILLILIRSFGDYADGLAFAVLIMNTLVPLSEQMSSRHAT